MKQKRTLRKQISFLLIASLFAAILTGCGVDLPENDEMPTPTGGMVNLLPTDSTFYNQASATPISTPTPEDSFEPAGTQSTTIYYLTDEGYTFPVNVEIPRQEGIAKACLGYLVDTQENRQLLQSRGLRAVIPDGTGIEVNIVEGHAIVNLTNMPELSSAEAETSMFVSIVNTLTEFSTVDTVSIFIDGRNDKTKNEDGTPGSQGPYKLNVEPSEIATTGIAKPITLYFPNQSGSLNIPVTRYVEGSDDLYACISGIVEGTNLPKLRNCFPENTLVLAATIENGILTINLSSDFEKIAETPGLYDLACNTALLTGQQFGSVNEVRFLVNGEPFEP